MKIQRLSAVLAATAVLLVPLSLASTAQAAGPCDTILSHSCIDAQDAFLRGFSLTSMF